MCIRDRCMGATEIGQGADTVFSQMASETTGISFDKVYIVSTQDTDTTPLDVYKRQPVII